MSNKSHFIEDVFNTRIPEVKELIVSYNLPPTQSQADAWRKLNFLVKKFPNEVLPYLATIHPDKDLILSANQKLLGSGSEDNAEYFNCGGSRSSFSNCEGNTDCPCNAKNKTKFSGCDGCEAMKSSHVDGVTDVSIPANKSGVADHHVFAMVATVVILGIIVVASKNK